MRRSFGRWAPWLAAAVLVAGAVSYAASRLGGDGGSLPHRPAKLEAVELRVAMEFVRTAVARKHLDRAWTVAAPELKQGMSREQWMTGTIPVVPYPVAQARTVIRRVDSFTDTGTLEVRFLPRAGTKARPAAFVLDLRKEGGMWLVSAWLPNLAVAPRTGK